MTILPLLGVAFLSAGDPAWLTDLVSREASVWWSQLIFSPLAWMTLLLSVVALTGTLLLRISPDILATAAAMRLQPAQREVARSPNPPGAQPTERAV